LPAYSPRSTFAAIGKAFAPGAVVKWNGAALATTFVSTTKLTAVVPASDLAAPGTASVTVVNPSGGGESAALPFTILPAPLLSLSAANLTRSFGVIKVPITISNSGTAAADSLRITAASIGSHQTTTALPIALADL